MRRMQGWNVFYVSSHIVIILDASVAGLPGTTETELHAASAEASRRVERMFGCFHIAYLD